MLEATNTASDSTVANPALAAEAKIARVAVTVFPLLVVVAGAAGFLSHGVFKPLAPSVPYLLGIIMFCMGLTLTPPDFASVARRPWAVALGIVAHYVIMPGAGWLIAVALQLPPELAVGLILVGCAPSGTASNVMAFLAKGDVALSVAVASVSTLIAPLVTPALTLLLAGSFLHIDAGAMVLDIVKTVLLPVVAGLLARLFLKNLVAKVLPALPWASAVVISVIVAVVVAGSASKIVAAGGIVFLAVVLHNGFGLGLGYLAGKVGRLDGKARRALAFEVGMQNSGLAATLATAHFTPLAALPSAVFSVWHNISGALVAAWLARKPLQD
ncbi:bile acid:sodium symporter family protein [Arthrobacter cupressi]|uniref:Bile acid:Na+ symporter, BASS family n=1 Tax=Arthrobacter cupressi TaxID=1045773 RepID=A0A1G8QDI6_9MICC|nr:bile acid:sodium symporter family protein [Arthrobacter cupressi]NYD78103.1 BASS family bile acid:Na+ symporter [Arthrobacter cupressi]SDJ02656.1 bile acid:Na+ symporter, BASS family [Arthrobacter cupressi]